MITLSDTSFDPGAALADFTARAEGAGAIVSFTGLVRPDARTGAVNTLTLQAYSPMTERGIKAAVSEAETRWPLNASMVIHRVGDMAPGEPIVFVATASAHRRAAFEGADFLMDYLKTEAVFWKKETGPTGSTWIEPRDEDYADSARWADTQG
ncbi:MAG: molybdenum cofactor biosynthesis protein MoaE [Pseudomonadota bacterium]